MTAITAAIAAASAVAQGNADADSALPPRGTWGIPSSAATDLAYIEAYDARLAELVEDNPSERDRETYARLLRDAQHPNGQQHRALIRNLAEVDAELAALPADVVAEAEIDNEGHAILISGGPVAWFLFDAFDGVRVVRNGRYVEGFETVAAAVAKRAELEGERDQAIDRVNAEVGNLPESAHSVTLPVHDLRMLLHELARLRADARH